MPRRFLLALLALCLTAHALAHGGLGHWVGGAQGPSHAWLHHEGVAHEHGHQHEHGHGHGDAAQPQLKATPEALAHVLADALGCSPALLPHAPFWPRVPAAGAHPRPCTPGTHPHPFLAGLERPPRHA
jgi:hypothetical protein